MPLSGFKPSAFRPTAKRFPGLRTAAWTDTYENPSNALIAGREQLSGNGEESEKAIWSVAGF